VLKKVLEFEQQLAKEGAYICCRNFINDFLIAKVDFEK
jgi:hypothetical protein